MTTVVSKPEPHGKAPRHGVSRPAPAAPAPSAWTWSELAGFGTIAAQFAMLVLAVRWLHIEDKAQFSRLLVLAFGGFLVHHFLPRQWRMPFFACLSLVGTVYIAGPVVGTVLVVVGMALVGLCHLPLAFGARLVLLLGALALLTLWRWVGPGIPAWTVDWLSRGWLVETIWPHLAGGSSQMPSDAMGEILAGFFWPVFGSMFMLRMLVYLYDLRTGTAPFGPARSVSYFFMLPNVCFPMFPVVDYKTFCATHYNENPLRIYQTGVTWIMRGAVQLVLYRVVYHFGVLDTRLLTDAGDVLWFMICTFLLYLKLSGQFHMIVGLLHLFGFNLPETHHRYLLSSSFTDLWRRINIYWRDFITKLVFYPVYLRIKDWGPKRALSVATLAAFAVTWALHSWQYFWLGGKWLLAWQDMLFWFLLALLVLASALREADKGRARSLQKPKRTLRGELQLALRTVATFLILCVLWTIWSSTSIGELRQLAQKLVIVELADLAIVAAALAALGAAAVILGHTTQERTEGRRLAPAKGPAWSWRPAAAVAVMAAILMCLGRLAPLHDVLGDELATALSTERLNQRDEEMRVRGYYEELDVGRFSELGRVGMVEPEGWEAEEIFIRNEGFLKKQLKPSASEMHRGAMMTTNRWGMRDRDYELAKPPGTIRIALLGSSHEMGAGVTDDEVLDEVLERLLVEEAAGGLHYEVLNFSAGGRSIPENMHVIEETVLGFSPDLVLLFTNSSEYRRTVDNLVQVTTQDRPIPWPDLADLVRDAGVDPEMPPADADLHLSRHEQDIVAWTFAHLAAFSEERGLPAFVVFRPSASQSARRERPLKEEILGLAAAAGVSVIDLSPAYAGVDRETLVVADFDDHTNALGHRLLGHELFAQLQDYLATIRQTQGE